MLSPRKGDSRPDGTVETGMGRRERLPHIWTRESACPTFVSLQFVGCKAHKDKAEALVLQKLVSSP